MKLTPAKVQHTRQLAQVLKDIEYLESKGLKWEDCVKCKGTGRSQANVIFWACWYPCLECNGNGGHWRG